jgi:DNA primase
MLVRHGEKVMCNVEDENGEEQPLHVIEYIHLTLQDDNLQFRDPLHQRILNEAVEHAQDEDFRCTRYFENHPDETISALSIELAHDKETLSNVHSKGGAIPPEEERLADILPHLMIDYKLAIVEETLRHIQQELRNPSTRNNREQLQRLMKEFQETKQIQKELGHQAGDRVLMKS